MKFASIQMLKHIKSRARALAGMLRPVDKSSTIKITPEQYDAYFRGHEVSALNRALDTRKFEIELYWKRAAYFWTFIGATFAGFLAIQAYPAENKDNLSVILSCLGIVFSFAWFCVNRGSKFWQENWEKHVDVLEDKVSGPLYKVVLCRNVDGYGKLDRAKDLVAGPSRISVSKVNQLISLYVFLLWILLLVESLAEFNWLHAGIVGLTAAACISFVTPLGRTYGGGYWHDAELRKSRVKHRRRGN